MLPLFFSKKTTSSEKPPGTKKKKNGLDCGKPVNLTEYDNLRGIANRHNHPHIPEPEVAMIFRKKGSKNTEVDMNELEKRLKKTRKEVNSICQVIFSLGTRRLYFFISDVYTVLGLSIA